MKQPPDLPRSNPRPRRSRAGAAPPANPDQPTAAADTTADRLRTALAVLQRLEPLYGRAAPLLTYDSPFQLLISVILSAQTTDATVNSVTPALFARFPDAPSLAAADRGAVEELIHATGFFRTKARNICGAAQAVVERFAGAVPATMEELTTLPGVGRKSAGVILHHVYGRPAIIVDTHFGRVCRRLGLTDATDPTAVERDIAALPAPEYWSALSMYLNLHGRYRCTARKAQCDRCEVADLCPIGRVRAVPPRGQ